MFSDLMKIFSGVMIREWIGIDLVKWFFKKG